MRGLLNTSTKKSHGTVTNIVMPLPNADHYTLAFAFHQVPITAGWTEVAWYERFVQDLYKKNYGTVTNMVMSLTYHFGLNIFYSKDMTKDQVKQIAV